MSTANKPNQEAYKTGEPIAFLGLELKHGELHLLPYSSLISVHLQPECGNDQHEQLELTNLQRRRATTGGPGQARQIH